MPSTSIFATEPADLFADLQKRVPARRSDGRGDKLRAYIPFAELLLIHALPLKEESASMGGDKGFRD
jgi:hypothetical protein